jgi:hypothetical protein
MARRVVRRGLVTTGAAAIALALAIAATPTQVQLPSPPTIGGGYQQQLPPVSIEDAYGPLQVEDLEQLARSGQSYHRRLVKTRGVLGDLAPGQYLALGDLAARVLVIPMQPGDYHDLGTMNGIDVDLTGVVRVLPTKQDLVPCRGTRVLESKCEDWDLPVLPNAQANWPPVSITVVRISDRGTSGGPRKERRTLADTGLDAAAADGKPVRALGQFRGANLCKDLPEASRHDPADWVLHTTEGSVWVTGRRPAGKGFQLDAAYRGDTTRWLEVSGKVLILENVRYLKASKVVLIPRPPEAEPVACPP